MQEGPPQRGGLRQPRVGHPLEEGLGQLLPPGDGGVGPERRLQLVQLPGEGVLSVFHRLIPGVEPAIPEQLVGVEPVGQRGERDVQVRGQEGLDRPVRGRLPRRVPVHDQHDPVAEAPEHAGVARGERGAQGGDHVGGARLVAGDHVRVALDHHGGAGLQDGLFGEVQPVERPLLVEDVALGGVEVLGVVLVAELPAAEGDGPAQGVADREDEPVPEHVEAPALGGVRAAPGGEVDRVAFAPVAGADQAGGGEGLRVPALAPDHRLQAVPAVRGHADAEAFDGLRGDAPGLQGRPAGGPVGAVAEHGLEEGLGLGARLGQPPPRGLLGRCPRPRVPVGTARGGAGPKRAHPAAGPGLPGGELDAGPLGEELQRFDELQPVEAHHEVEGGPARPAREALEDLLRGRDPHRRLPVVVEGAEPDELTPRRPQRHVLAHERDQVGRRQHLFSVVVAGEGHGDFQASRAVRDRTADLRRSKSRSDRTTTGHEPGCPRPGAWTQERGPDDPDQICV